MQNKALTLILNGWISPDGTIYSCGFEQHSQLALQIAKANGFSDKCIWSQIYTCMWDLGYLRFSCPYPGAAMEFEEDAWTSEKEYIELTEAQKMAQARLLKQFHEKVV